MRLSISWMNLANIDEESIPYFMEQIKLLGEEGKAICIIDHRLEYWDWINRWYLLDDYGDLKENKTPSSYRR